MTRPRLHYLDAVRVIACIMVVLMHSPGPFAGQASSGLFQSTLYYLTAPCIGLFFMVSGALLLPAAGGTGVFLRKRMSKVLSPALVWTVFYIFVHYDAANCPPHQLVKSIMSIPFSPQGSGIMWFMYVLVGLYLITPLISPWLRDASKRSVEFYLLLWVVTLCLPLVGEFLTVSIGATSPYYYVSGYAGYFLLGYYMRRWPDAIRWRLLLPMLAAALVAPAICKVIGLKVDFIKVFWYLSIFVAVMCAAWFKAAHWLFAKTFMKNRKFSLLGRISGLSFGIYLFHIFLLRDILWHVSLLNQIDNYILHTFTVAAITFVGALAVSYIISLLPIGAYLVGCRNFITSRQAPEKCN